MTRKVTRTLFERFYAWFARHYPTDSSIVGGEFSRRELRNAYEAGWYARAKRKRGKGK